MRIAIAVRGSDTSSLGIRNRVAINERARRAGCTGDVGRIDRGDGYRLSHQFLRWRPLRAPRSSRTPDSGRRHHYLEPSLWSHRRRESLRGARPAVPLLRTPRDGDLRRRRPAGLTTNASVSEPLTAASRAASRIVSPSATTRFEVEAKTERRAPASPRYRLLRRVRDGE